MLCITAADDAHTQPIGGNLFRAVNLRVNAVIAGWTPNYFFSDLRKA
jgi:hypothetical protein